LLHSEAHKDCRYSRVERQGCLQSAGMIVATKSAWSPQCNGISMRGAKSVTTPHPRSVDARDAEIGRLVRARRQKLRLSQSDLAEHIGVTFQQVQKYENGTNRISIGRLTRIAEVLDVPPTFFFARETKAGVAIGNKSREFLAAPGALRLIRAYDRLRGGELRTAFVEFAESIAKSEKRGG
jgi:transcriptional regulator with XRE-family HTH domain